MAAWRAAADHPADRAVLASLSRFETKRPRFSRGLFAAWAVVPGEPQVEDNVAADVTGGLPPIPRIK